jgi:hypothetical protein
VGHNLRPLGRKSTTHDCTLTWNNDPATDVLDVGLEVKPKEFEGAVGAIYQPTRAGSPLVILHGVSGLIFNTGTVALTSRSFFIIEV